MALARHARHLHDTHTHARKHARTHTHARARARARTRTHTHTHTHTHSLILTLTLTPTTQRNARFSCLRRARLQSLKLPVSSSVGEGPSLPTSSGTHRHRTPLPTLPLWPSHPLAGARRQVRGVLAKATRRASHQQQKSSDLKKLISTSSYKRYALKSPKILQSVVFVRGCKVSVLYCRVNICCSRSYRRLDRRRRRRVGRGVANSYDTDVHTATGLTTDGTAAKNSRTLYTTNILEAFQQLA